METRVLSFFESLIMTWGSNGVFVFNNSYYFVFFCVSCVCVCVWESVYFDSFYRPLISSYTTALKPAAPRQFTAPLPRRDRLVTHHHSHVCCSFSSLYTCLIECLVEIFRSSSTSRASFMSAQSIKETSRKAQILRIIKFVRSHRKEYEIAESFVENCNHSIEN